MDKARELEFTTIVKFKISRGLKPVNIKLDFCNQISVKIDAD
jgi:hypothetical protein